jgi:hypothetical protein
MGSKTGSQGTDHGATNRIILLQVAVLAVGIVVQHVITSAVGQDGPLQSLAVVVGIVTFAATLAACTSKRIFDSVASARFGVVSLVMLTLLSIMGTVVLQGEQRMAFDTTYGPLSPMLRALFVDDLFHSYGFSGLLGLASGALVATLFTSRRLTLKRVGVLGAHLGCVVTLVGAAAGSVWGVKGRLNLHVDEQSSSFFVQSADGQVSEVPLGFTVRLDEFDLLKYEPAFRLKVVEIDGEKQDLVASFDPEDERSSGALLDHGVELLGYWPDHAREMDVRPADEKSTHGSDVSGLALADGSGVLTWILDPKTPQGGRLRGTNETTVAFVWEQVRAEQLLSSIERSGGSPHVMLVGNQRKIVEIGKSYELPDSAGSYRLLSAFKDFVIDPNTKKPSDRSDAPDNPAVQVEIKDAQGNVIAVKWMFAKFPDFKHDAGTSGPDLRYVYDTDGLGFDKGLLLVGETSEVWTIRSGKVAGKAPFSNGTNLSVDGATLTVKAIHRYVAATQRNVTLSDRATNPVAEVRLVGDQRTMFIVPGQAVELADEGLVLALTPKGDDVRDYLSTLTVLENGVQVLSQKVEVNHPLSHGGYHLYQSDYDPRDPTFSGFQVVKDPGLVLVYVGLAMMLLAVTHVILVVPVVRRLKRTRGPAAANGGK